jgi:hypothetical protein
VTRRPNEPAEPWGEDTTTRRNQLKQVRSPSSAPTNPKLVLEQKCPVCGDIYDGMQDTCPRDGTPLYQATQRAQIALKRLDSFDDFDIVATKVGLKEKPAVVPQPLNHGDTLPPDDTLLNRTLDERYRIVRRLGKGSMSIVYVAEQLSIRRKVAVKVLSPATGVDLRELNQRFEAEAQIIARLTHPNTVRLFDNGRTPDGRPYFVTELLSGQSLEDVLKEGPLNSVEVLEVVRQIGRSLEEAHALGIVHRDLKPANIFIDRSVGHLVVKILDFGVARVTAAVSQNLRPGATIAGTLLGTPAYMAPEQCLGNPVGPRSDLYSLGVIAYHCLAGEPPFKGGTATLLGQHVSATPRPLDKVVPGLDPRIESLVMSMLAKKPEERPASAGWIASHIDDLERSGTVWAVPVLAPVPKTKEKKKKRRSLLPHIVIAGLGVLFALLAAAFVRPDPRPVPAGYVDAPVSDDVHHTFFLRVGEGKYADAIKALEEANRSEPHYDTVFNIVAAYDAWGGHCTEVTGAIERFMMLCMNCPRAAAASSRFGRIYERCSSSVMIGSVPSGAKLWIDGVERGTTPFVMMLPAGNHIAEVQLQGRRQKKAFENSAGHPAHLTLTLE